MVISCPGGLPPRTASLGPSRPAWAAKERTRKHREGLLGPWMTPSPPSLPPEPAGGGQPATTQERRPPADQHRLARRGSGSPGRGPDGTDSFSVSPAQEGMTVTCPQHRHATRPVTFCQVDLCPGSPRSHPSGQQPASPQALRARAAAAQRSPVGAGVHSGTSTHLGLRSSGTRCWSLPFLGTREVLRLVPSPDTQDVPPRDRQDAGVPEQKGPPGVRYELRDGTRACGPLTSGC